MEESDPDDQTANLREEADVPQGQGANEAVQADLVIEDHTILHLYDEATRFSQAVVVLNRSAKAKACPKARPLFLLRDAAAQQPVAHTRPL